MLYAANNSIINTFGECRLSLDFGFRRKFDWKFLVASVPYPIIGVDLLSAYDLSVDLQGKRLIDAQSGAISVGIFKSAPFSDVSLVDYSSKFQKRLKRFPNLIGISQSDKIAPCNIQHHILTTGPPIAERARRLSSEKLSVAKTYFQKLQKENKCRRSSASWAAPLHLAPNRKGGWRVCGDYRRLNSVTIPDRYPVPFIQDVAAMLFGKKIFSTLDLEAAYNQIPIAPEDIPKTAVITPFGLFEFTVMTFGLRNAGQTFQRFLHQILGDLNFVFSYIDDLLIASTNDEEHEKHLHIIFDRLDQAGLRLNLGKCTFGRTEIEFLGYFIDKNGIRPLPEKVRSITNYSKPKNILELRRFLGFVNFYRKSLPNIAEAQKPLNSFLHKSKKNDKREIPWTSLAEEAFEKCKSSVANAVLLAHPSSGSPTRVVSDASDTGMGASLEQFQNNEWKPLGFFSRSFTPTQKRYSTYDRELTAAYEAVKYFKHELEGREFHLVTDHKPLIYAFSQKSDKASPRQQRQLSFLSQFTTKLEYIPGVKNVVADSLSRIDLIRLATDMSLIELSEAQSQDEELKNLMNDQST